MKIGLLLENLFDEQEFIYPYYRVQEAGFEAIIIGSDIETYSSKSQFQITADVAAADIDAADLDGLIIPGGYAPDRIRRFPDMLRIIKDVSEQGKPVGSICHASWAIISAKIVKGKQLTGHPSTRDDLENAGAHYQEDRVVTDGNLVTAQHYIDLPAFMQAYLRLLAN